jgi:hypothetical protein
MFVHVAYDCSRGFLCNSRCISNLHTYIRECRFSYAELEADTILGSKERTQQLRLVNIIRFAVYRASIGGVTKK